jgi:hypothetical protein
MRILLNQGKLPDNLCKQLRAEAANHSTDVINWMCTSINKIPRYEQFHGHKPTFVPYL